MVYFTCNACGEALKKAAVEKHYTFKCRSCTVLSCIDCGKDFHGEEYQNHTKCITEAEKYQGADYKPKTNANKGEVKQDSWIDFVHTTVTNNKDTGELGRVLKYLLNYTNVPRKEKKFDNFLKTAANVYSSDMRSKAWKVLSDAKQAQDAQQSKPETVPTEQPAAMEPIEEETEQKKKKSSKREKKEERSLKQTKKQKRDRGKTDAKPEVEAESNENGHEIKSKKKRKGGEASSGSEDFDKKKGKSEDESENDSPEETEVEKKKRMPMESDIGEKKLSKKKRKAKALQEASNGLHDETKLSKKMRKELSNGAKPGKRKRGNDEEDCAVPGKRSKSGIVQDAAEEEEMGRFNWGDVITRVLTASGGELAVKKLRKKVLSSYLASDTAKHEESEVKLWAKFDKRLTKNRNIRVLKEKARLVL